MNLFLFNLYHFYHSKNQIPFIVYTTVLQKQPEKIYFFSLSINFSNQIECGWKEKNTNKKETKMEYSNKTEQLFIINIK